MPILRGLPIADYFAAPDVSSTKLKDFAKSARLYYDKWVTRELGAFDDPEEDTESKIFGRAFECMVNYGAKCVINNAAGTAIAIREPGNATGLAEFVVKPDGIDGRTTKGKEWKAAHEGKTIVSEKEVRIMLYMLRSIIEHDCAEEMLGECEQQVTIRAEVAGLPLQARPDFVNLKGSALSEWRPYTMDLKTTNDLDRILSGRAVVQYGYHIQSEFCGLTLAENGFKRSSLAHYLLVVEKCLPHRCEVLEVHEGYLIHAGSKIFGHLVDLGRCMETDTWPRSRGGIQKLEKPRWLKDEEEVA